MPRDISNRVTTTIKSVPSKASGMVGALSC
jgi:hypothetical protein